MTSVGHAQARVRPGGAGEGEGPWPGSLSEAKGLRGGAARTPGERQRGGEHFWAAGRRADNGEEAREGRGTGESPVWMPCHGEWPEVGWRTCRARSRECGEVTRTAADDSFSGGWLAPLEKRRWPQGILQCPACREQCHPRAMVSSENQLRQEGWRTAWSSVKPADLPTAHGPVEVKTEGLPGKQGPAPLGEGAGWPPSSSLRGRGCFPGGAVVSGEEVPIGPTHAPTHPSGTNLPVLHPLPILPPQIHPTAHPPLTLPPIHSQPLNPFLNPSLKLH